MRSYDDLAAAQARDPRRAYTAARHSTKEAVPLTDAMRRALRHSHADQETGAVGLAVFILFFIVALFLLGPHDLGTDLFFLALIGLGVFLVYQKKRRVESDVQDDSFMRLTGMIYGEVDRGGDDIGYYLIVEGRRLPTDSEAVIEQIQTPAWRSVDVSWRSHLVFEVRDEHGAIVCRDWRYVQEQ
jgi:hypothetical protein